MSGNDSCRPDAGSLSYCSLECAGQCPVFKATVTNDRAVKQAVADIWTKEIGKAFTADDVFCYGCKQEGKPQNEAVLKCAVRRCAKDKQMESCSLCGDLSTCGKNLWKRWPDVKMQALGIQRIIMDNNQADDLS